MLYSDGYARTEGGVNRYSIYWALNRLGRWRCSVRLGFLFRGLFGFLSCPIQYSICRDFWVIMDPGGRKTRIGKGGADGERAGLCDQQT